MASTDRAALSYAGFWIRASAALVDVAIVNLMALLPVASAAIASAAFDASSVALLAAILLSPPLVIAYFTYCHARWGQTLGKYLLAVQVQGRNGRPPTSTEALVRTIVACASCLLLHWGIGAVDCLVVIFRRDRQALHDIAAGTVVRRVRYISRRRVFVVGLLGLTLTLAVAWVGSFLAHTFYLPSGVMQPTIQVGDRAMANMLVYHWREPRVGEVVVLRSPRAANFRPYPIIRRVVGLPGDRLSVHDGRVYRNGQTLDETYAPQPIRYSWPLVGRQEFAPGVLLTRDNGGREWKCRLEDGSTGRVGEVLVPAASYMVLGDNRNDSNDSPRWMEQSDGHAQSAPFVPRTDLLGRMEFIYYPLAHARDLSAP